MELKYRKPKGQRVWMSSKRYHIICTMIFMLMDRSFGDVSKDHSAKTDPGENSYFLIINKIYFAKSLDT